jgi:hypothetical protein
MAFLNYKEKKQLEAMRLEFLLDKINLRAKEEILVLYQFLYRSDTESILVSWESSSRGNEWIEISEDEILKTLVKNSIPRSIITVGELEDVVSEIVSNKINFLITAPSAVLPL